mgnify:CR=1 FL=1
MNWRTFFIVAAVYDLVLGAAVGVLVGPVSETIPAVAGWAMKALSAPVTSVQ